MKRQVQILKKIFTSLLTLIVLAAPFVVLANLQNIRDWQKLRNYTPPPAVSQIVAQDAMTPNASRIFYINRPQLVNEVHAFRQQCKIAEQTIVLGCYHAGQEGIAIYIVQDARLNGIVQVTAAHEMLHAAYERLGSNEKNKIDNLLENYYTYDLKDQRIKETIKSYKKTEPNDVVNEMHSIFGTEIGNLPPALENHYKKYFSNRAAVVGLANTYQAEFTSRRDKVDSYDEKLASLKSQIDVEQRDLEEQYSALKTQQQILDNLRSSGKIEEYNAAVPGYNQLVKSYNAGITNLTQQIKAYNNLVIERNIVAKDLEGLTEALDTRLAPQSTQ